MRRARYWPYHDVQYQKIDRAIIAHSGKQGKDAGTPLLLSSFEGVYCKLLGKATNQRFVETSMK